MVFKGKSLADGLMKSTKQTLYSVPAGYRAIVNFIMCHNTDTTPQIVEIYLKRDAGSAISRDFATSAQILEDKTFFPLDPGEEITLSEGDMIEGKTVTDDVVTFWISGAEEKV